MITLLYAAGAAAVIACVVNKACRWDPTERLRATQGQERHDALEVVRVFGKYFPRLENGDGLVTHDAVRDIQWLDAPEADKDLLTQFILQAGPRAGFIFNPWVLGPCHEYEYVRLGHLIGKRQEPMVAPAVYGPNALLYYIDVDDYAISRADIESYVDRVNAKRDI